MLVSENYFQSGYVIRRRFNEGPTKMEGDPVDTWTTVDRKVSKKKPKSEESGSVADEGWSQVGKDRRKKDSVGPSGRSGQDRGERRGDRGDRRGDRGRPPAGGRGGSNQRGTLPRKYPPREGGGAGNARSQRNTPSPAPTATTTWEIKPGRVNLINYILFIFLQQCFGSVSLIRMLSE